MSKVNSIENTASKRPSHKTEPRAGGHFRFGIHEIISLVKLRNKRPPNSQPAVNRPRSSGRSSRMQIEEEDTILMQIVIHHGGTGALLR